MAGVVSGCDRYPAFKRRHKSRFASDATLSLPRLKENGTGGGESAKMLGGRGRGGVYSDRMGGVTATGRAKGREEREVDGRRGGRGGRVQVSGTDYPWKVINLPRDPDTPTPRAHPS